MDKLREHLPNGSDVTYEISGSSHALSQAVQVTGYNAKVVIGSWYGNNSVNTFQY